MNNYDTIIIGGGLSGLQAAYILAKEGQKVCVLEQHHTIGGCLQSFKRKDVFFDTGVHYIGSLDKNQVLYKYFKYFNLIDNIKYKKLDIDAFDVINYKNKEYKFAQGYDNFADKLIKKFPNEKNGILAYIKKIQEIEQVFPLHNLKPLKTTLIPRDVLTINTKAFIESVIKNKDLQNILAGNNALYAGVADKTPFYMHALITSSFIESSYRLVGGSQQLADSLTESIKSFGGDVFVNKQVKEILTQGKQATQVITKTGEVFSAKKFISAIHPANTLKMLKTNVIKKVYRNRINNLKNTSSMFILYAKLKKNKIKYLNYNYYKIFDNDVWNGYNYTNDNWPRGYLYVTPANTESNKYADTLTILSYMNFADVKKWENTTVGNRGNDYLEFKKQKAERLLNLTEKTFRGTISGIESYYTSTPLTYRDYTGTPDGSVYGILKDSNDPLPTFISPRTKIENLFLTGQNLNMHGVLGVTISSVATCSEILGSSYILDKIKKAQ